MGCGGSKSVGVEEAPTSSPKVAERAMEDLGTMTYFAGLRSRGEPTQMLIAAGGLNMKVELISFEEWGQRKGKVAPFMPYITDPNGKVMVETEVICKFLAEKGGKFTVDANQEALLKLANGAPLQLADPVVNLPDQGASVGIVEEEWFKAAALALKGIADKLGDQPFFGGEKPGYAEPFLWHNLNNLFFYGKARFEEEIGADAMAKLSAFYDRFAALDGIKEYLAGRPKQFGAPGSKLNPQ